MILTLMSTVAPGCVLLCQYMGKMAANECACKRASINIIAIYTVKKKNMLSTAHTYRTVCKYHLHMCEHTIIGNITIHNACLPHSSGLFSNASRQNSRHAIPKKKKKKNSPSPWQPPEFVFQVSLADALKHCRRQTFSHVHGRQIRLHLETPIH